MPGSMAGHLQDLRSDHQRNRDLTRHPGLSNSCRSGVSSYGGNGRRAPQASGARPVESHSDAIRTIEHQCRDTVPNMPRTTLLLEDDAMKAARDYAVRHRMSLGRAVSELVRQGTERPLVTEKKGGLHVVRLGRRSPKVTSALVDKLLEDLP